MESQSMRLWAWAGGNEEEHASRAKEMNASLLIAERLHRIELGRAAGRIEAGKQTDNQSECDRAQHQPPGNEPDLFGWKVLLLEIDVHAEINDASNCPPQRDAHGSAQ